MLSELSNPLSSKIFCTQQAIRLQNYLSQQQVGSFVGTEELSLLLNIDQYSLNGVLEELVVVDYLTHSEIHECSEAECRGNELTQSGDHFECDLCDRKFRFEPKSKRSGFRLLKSIPRSERQVTSMFNVFLTDVVVLKKADGRVFPNIKASVQDTILITGGGTGMQPEIAEVCGRNIDRGPGRPVRVAG